MNKKQKIVLIVVAIVILLMLLYPPFQITYRGSISNTGYGFIMNPPKAWSVVNSSTLLLQWLGVLIVGVLVFFLLKDNGLLSSRKVREKNEGQSNTLSVFQIIAILLGVLVLVLIILIMFF